jgi:hypothetical protein
LPNVTVAPGSNWVPLMVPHQPDVATTFGVTLVNVGRSPVGAGVGFASGAGGATTGGGVGAAGPLGPPQPDTASDAINSAIGVTRGIRTSSLPGTFRRRPASVVISPRAHSRWNRRNTTRYRLPRQRRPRWLHRLPPPMSSAAWRRTQPGWPARRWRAGSRKHARAD